MKQIESIDTATGMPHPLRKRFVAPGKAIAQSIVELSVDSKPVSIGTIVDADGWILTKEPPSIARALCAVGPDQRLKPGIVSVETRAIPPEPRWKGDATEDTRDGPMISRLNRGWQNKMNLSTSGTKLQFNDIIVSINGHSTPNVSTLTQVLETSLAEYCTGDLVSVALRRKGSPMKVLTPLPRATVVNYWTVDEYDTPRRSGFAAVIDTDIKLLQREVGCPVIDVEGRMRGIAIASRGRSEIQRSPTSVLPSRIVSRVTKRLMAEASKK